MFQNYKARHLTQSFDFISRLSLGGINMNLLIAEVKNTNAGMKTSHIKGQNPQSRNSRKNYRAACA